MVSHGRQGQKEETQLSSDAVLSAVLVSSRTCSESGAVHKSQRMVDVALNINEPVQDQARTKRSILLSEDTVSSNSPSS